MGQISAAFRKSGWASAITVAAGAAAGVLLAVAATAQERAGSVNIVNFAFTPQTVTVAAKTPITWTNKDDAPHQAVVSGKGSTAVLQKGKSGRLTIAEAGTYDYVCGLHPSMTGRIEVK